MQVEIEPGTVHADVLLPVEGDARREALAQDASTRSYTRLFGQGTAIFMDAPPGQADSVADFVKVDAHLLALGLSAPKILAQDIAQGFLLLEDLGDGLYPAVIAAVDKVMRDGLSFGVPNALEVTMAQTITRLVPSCEMVRMVNSGTEAVMSALRLASSQDLWTRRIR